MKENIGKSGRLYFTYGIGAEFELYARSKLFAIGNPIAKLRIINCLMNSEETEQYAFTLESYGKKGACKEQTEPIDRFEELLDAGNAEQITPGEAVELPLIKSEVRHYFLAKAKRRREALAEANRILTGTQEKDSKGRPKKDKKGKEIWTDGNEEYRNLTGEQGKLETQIARFVSQCKPTPAFLAERYRDICERKREIIEEAQIPIELFMPEKICPACNNKGIAEWGEICECALGRKEEIKEYCAMNRIKKRLSEEWVASLSPEKETEEGDEEEEPIADEESIEGDENSAEVFADIINENEEEQ